jgi:predicted transcriptional regulator
MKNMTVRLDDDLAHRVEVIAKVHDISIAEAIRAAIEGYVAEQLATDTFRTKLRAIVAADQRLLEREDAE